MFSYGSTQDTQSPKCPSNGHLSHQLFYLSALWVPACLIVSRLLTRIKASRLLFMCLLDNALLKQQCADQQLHCCQKGDILKLNKSEKKLNSYCWQGKFVNIYFLYKSSIGSNTLISDILYIFHFFFWNGYEEFAI